MRRMRSAALMAAATALVMLTAACSSDKDTERIESTAVEERAKGADPVPMESLELSPAGQLSIWKSPAVGDVVTDGAGFTLYRFDNDTAKPSKTNCEGDCATSWPPVRASDAQAAAGMDPALLGKVTRTDGAEQLTLAGWPLYRFAKDTRPRQTNGEGVGGTWFAAAADGGKASEAAKSGQAGGSGEAGAAGALPPLSTVKNTGLGDIVRDAGGRTLYRFTKDTDWPMSSACTGACLDKWKPAKMPAKADLKRIEGIDPKLVIPFNREDDGTVQLTIDCWPLYWFTGDRKPGDISGQGVGGTWFAVRADGSLAK
ncbi:SCO0930 family lipoprotein [Streptomyces sp. CAU 1734]|uniref:SCO0930 family lipoprotein n=1 Tax=Streptomyces sp. CAU 1734 TaxID=3140360 RepID=UPI0032615DC3